MVRLSLDARLHRNHENDKWRRLSARATTRIFFFAFGSIIKNSHVDKRDRWIQRQIKKSPRVIRTMIIDEPISNIGSVYMSATR